MLESPAHMATSGFATRRWPWLAVVLTLCAPARTDADSTYVGRRHAADDTLVIGAVSGIAPDLQGHLWLATASGLVRFDGAHFSAWSTLDGTTRARGRISGLMTARDGSLWFGASSAINRIVNGHMETFTDAQGFAGGSVGNLLEDQQGTIWAGARSGLARLNGKHWTYVSVSGSTQNERVYSLYEDRHGALWVASFSGLFRRRAGSDTFERVCSETVWDIVEHPDTGMWWLGRNGIVSHLSDCSGPASTPSAGVATHTRRLFLDRSGHIWASTERGLFRSVRLSGTTATMERVQPRELRSSTVLAFYDDGEGNLWLGTDQGLIRLFEPTFRTHSTPHGMPLPTSTVAVTKSGLIWAGTTRGLYRIVPRAGEFTVQPSAITEPVIALHADASDRLWVATSSGVVTLAGNRFHRLEGMDVSDVFSMTTGTDHSLWYCHAGSPRLFRWRNGSAAAVELGQNLNGKVCGTVAASPTGAIWVGFVDGTLGVGDPVGHSFRRAAKLSSRVCAIRDGGTSGVWISTDDGLHRLRQGAVASATVANGFPDVGFTTSVPDDAGNVWLGTGSGVIALPATELDTVQQNARVRVRFRVFDASDGLMAAPIPCTSSGVARDNHGRVWFATPTGPVAVDPRRAKTRTPVVQIQIARLLVNGVPVPLVHPITIAPKPSTVQFDYEASSLSAGSKLRFRYRLDGVNRDWVEAGARRAAYYTTLPPGTYRFRVHADIGGAEAAVTTTDVRVEPALHQTAAFFVLCLAGTAALTAGLALLRHRANGRQFRAVLAERSRIAREIHDTVLQGMAGAALEIESAALGADEPTFGELRRIRRRLEERLTDARRSILDLRSETTSSQSLAELLRSRGASLANGGAAIHVTVVGMSRRSPFVDEQLLRIGEEAVTNALRHGRPGRIDVTVTYGPDDVRLAVADDGRGFCAESSPERPHWGIRGMQERARTLGGSVHVLPGPRGGTVVEVIIPLRAFEGSPT